MEARPDQQEERPHSRPFDRRRLLAVAGASAVAAVLPTAASAKAPTNTPRSPVGYVLGSDAWPSLGPAVWGGMPTMTVVPAQSVAGDGTLASSLVSMHIQGLSPGLPSIGQSGVSAATLDVLFQGGTKARPAVYPFSAWSFASGPRASCSSNLAFVVPVASDGGLEVQLVTTDWAGQSSGGVTRFSVERAPDLPKLRRGLYLLGLMSGLWSERTALDPSAGGDWSRLSIVVSVDAAK